MSKIIQIRYKEPTKRNNREQKSKLIDPKSDIYKFIHNIKMQLKINGFYHNDRTDLHTEVLKNDSETLEDFLSRVSQLEGREIDVYNLKNYEIMGNAIVLSLGHLPNYNKPHITIVFIENKEILSKAYNYIKNNITKI